MCSPSHIPYPELSGAQFTSLSASLVSNVSVQLPEGVYVHNGAVSAEGVSYCHITTDYTHIGQNDTIIVDVYLPTSGWNGRMQGNGGGGWTAGGVNAIGTHLSMVGAVVDGYSAVTTNAGHASLSPYDWVLQSNGEPNDNLLEDFNSLSLNELSIIGKAIVESHYGSPPLYSYWNGCSQGGRQGMKLASAYPKAFDGIAASTPAVDFIGMGIGNLWPQVFMNALGQYPKNCEFLAITEAAIEHCDNDDGLADNIISDPDKCDFDPFSVVNRSISCNDTGTPENVLISEAAAQIANATWTGPRLLNSSIPWWGLKKGARLIEQNVMSSTVPGLATTACSSNGTCVGEPENISEQWTQLLIEMDPTFDVSTVTFEDYQEMFDFSTEQYGVIFGVEPNLDAFRDAGGKVISYQGLADATLPPDATRHYFESVAARDKHVHDYYRVFEAPGLTHCHLSPGGYYPDGIFKALVAWVEFGVVPDKLAAHATSPNGTVSSGTLCPYPQKAYYNPTTNDFRCGRDNKYEFEKN